MVDHNCGFKAFKKSIAMKLVKEGGYDGKMVRGWFWDAEILIRAQQKGYKIKQIPVRWIEPKASSFSIKREMRMILYVLRLKGNLR